MRVYSAATANEAWKNIARDLFQDGDACDVPSRLGPTREFLHVVIEIEDPLQRWVPARVPAINPAFALAEVVWLVTGRDDTGVLSHWFPSYTKFVGEDAHQPGAYGARLRDSQGFDQLQRAYNALKHNPTSRQIVLQFWNAPDDLPDDDGQPRSPDVPCNLVSLLKVRRNELEWAQIVRSNDIDRGVPYNFVQFTTLQELMAAWLGLKVGRYVHVSDSIHLYRELSDRLAIDDQVIPEPNTDRFKEAFDESMCAFHVLGARMDEIVDARGRGIRPGYSTEHELPQPYENIFAIIAADDARRHGDFKTATLMAGLCQNPALLQMWDRWSGRVARKGTDQVLSRAGRIPRAPRTH